MNPEGNSYPVSPRLSAAASARYNDLIEKVAPLHLCSEAREQEGNDVLSPRGAVSLSRQLAQVFRETTADNKRTNSVD